LKTPPKKPLQRDDVPSTIRVLDVYAIWPKLGLDAL